MTSDVFCTAHLSCLATPPPRAPRFRGNRRLGRHTWSVPAQLYTVRLVPSLFSIYITEYTLYIKTGECLVSVGLSLGMLGSWVLDSIFYEWMWSGDEIKSQEGCTKLAHVKSYNRVVLQKEELWIFIFFDILHSVSKRVTNPLCCY